jgi:predicted transcriptional regulator
MVLKNIDYYGQLSHNIKVSKQREKAIMITKKIVIKSKEEFDSDALKFARKLDQGEKVKSQKGEFFESLEAVRNFLTEKRLELWRMIRDQEPKSLTELAELVKRNYKDVHQDVAILVEIGLVDLRKPKNSKTRALKPVSIVDRLEFRVA